MKIVLIRHFKVDFQWKKRYDSDSYEAACAGYNSSAVLKSDHELGLADYVITSTMARSIETSVHIFNRSPDASYQELCEVPIKPFMKTKRKLPKLLWDVIGRIQWRLNHPAQPESYTQSRERIRLFIEKLLLHERNVVVVCHGWVIKLIIKELRARNFKGPDPLFIRNGVPYEFVRN